jgi:hypothetical protein
MLVQTDTHERLTLSTDAPMAPPRRLGVGPWPGVSFQPYVGEDSDPGRGRAHFHDGAARLCVEAHRTPSGAYQPLCMDQAARLLLLVAMPSMDDISITLK